MESTVYHTVMPSHVPVFRYAYTWRARPHSMPVLEAIKPSVAGDKIPRKIGKGDPFYSSCTVVPVRYKHVSPHHAASELMQMGFSACFLLFGRSSGLYNRVETQPGLDQFSSDPDGLRDQSLGPLLEWAHAVVPERQWSSTPLFMLATAGLRKLPEAEQKTLMEGARGVLARSGFRCGPVGNAPSTYIWSGNSTAALHGSSIIISDSCVLFIN